MGMAGTSAPKATPLPHPEPSWGRCLDPPAPRQSHREGAFLETGLSPPTIWPFPAGSQLCSRAGWAPGCAWMELWVAKDISPHPSHRNPLESAPLWHQKYPFIWASTPNLTLLAGCFLSHALPEKLSLVFTVVSPGNSSPSCFPFNPPL